jgi:hypothetical protein
LTSSWCSGSSGVDTTEYEVEENAAVETDEGVEFVADYSDEGSYQSCLQDFEEDEVENITLGCEDGLTVKSYFRMVNIILTDA